MLCPCALIGGRPVVWALFVGIHTERINARPSHVHIVGVHVIAVLRRPFGGVHTVGFDDESVVGEVVLTQARTGEPFMRQRFNRDERPVNIHPIVRVSVGGVLLHRGQLPAYQRVHRFDVGVVSKQWNTNLVDSNMNLIMFHKLVRYRREEQCVTHPAEAGE